MRSIDFFDRGHDLDPGRDALVQGGRRWSFAELRCLSFRIAAGMRRDGLKRQDKVAIFSPNDARVVQVLLGLWRAGAVWIPINVRNALPANAAYLDYVEVDWLFFHSSYREEALQLRAQVPSIGHVVCLDMEMEKTPSLQQWLGSLSADDFIDTCDAFGNLQELVGIFATGGTTGPAKGVEVSNLGWGTMLGIAHNILAPRRAPPVSLVTAPITHAAGPVAIATLALGATNVILPGFDPLAVMQAIERHHVTHLYLPPTAMYMLLDHPDVGQYDYSSLETFVLVGSPVSPKKLQRAVEIFGPCLCQSYGQVEAPMMVCFLSQDEVAAAARGEHPHRLASCGRPTHPVRVAIMDEAGTLLPAGQSGEIVVRGCLVSLGYHKMPDATEEVRRFGWHHTGDIGMLDDAGYLYIVDRKKDMVVTGGFNVFTSEVEACINELPEVMESAVIGVPHELWGEAVKAVVVRARGSEIEEHAIIAHCKQRLGGVKAPKSVEFIDVLPKTPNNKLDKKTLRRRYWHDTERLVN